MRIAEELAAEYPGDQPFHLWLSASFRQRKSFGSKDRRFYREILYAWLRLGKWGRQLPLKARLLAGWLRLHPEDEDMKQLLAGISGFPAKTADFNELCTDLGEPYSPYQEWYHSLENGIDRQHLDQWYGSPAPVWIVPVKGRENQLLQFLTERNIHSEVHTGIIRLETGTPVEYAVSRGLCRIQDLGSHFSITEKDTEGCEVIWDACCGAGGKSLLIHELSPEAALYISDSRPHIVENALARFRSSGYPEPHHGVNSLSRPLKMLEFSQKIQFRTAVFDLIVCDVPCSGSGTWRRNPENLISFEKGQEMEYAEKQYRIVQHALPFLKPGGKLLYLTCSVFRAENSMNAERIQKDLSLELLDAGMTGGPQLDADYLYRALFRKI